MSGTTTILVPIRYPLTDASSQTLGAAGRLAQDHAPAYIRVLHVNLYQNGDHTQTRELAHAISSTLDDVEASVTTRQGFLVEEVILEEALEIGADIIVTGADQRALWRKFLSRVFGTTPAISTYLSDNTPDGTEIKEIAVTAGTPTVTPV